MDSLIDRFIKPERAQYQDHDLGHRNITKNNNTFKRSDHIYQRPTGSKIYVSFFENCSEFSETTLLYLHTHNGSRVQGLSLVRMIVEVGLPINVCLFDFAGYGRSQGKQTSLGFKEAEQIDEMIQFLQVEKNQKSIILWGRSMGAVSALIYLGKIESSFKNRVIGGIYDSPFSSFERLLKQLSIKLTDLPLLVLYPFIMYAQGYISRHLDIQKLNLQKIDLSEVSVPGIFIASKRDSYINSQHTERLHSKYGGERKLIYIESDHNECRSMKDFEPAFNFLKEISKEKCKWQLVMERNLVSALKRKKL